MFRNLTANLVLNERIETTDAKAKELRRVAERLITKAIRLGEVAYTPLEKLSEVDKGKRLATKRLISAFLPRWGTRVEKGGETKKVDLVEKVLLDLAKRFSERPGGYTRIVKMGPRRGDNAPLVIIEFVDQAVRPARATRARRRRSEAGAQEGGGSEEDREGRSRGRLSAPPTGSRLGGDRMAAGARSSPSSFVAAAPVRRVARRSCVFARGAASRPSGPHFSRNAAMRHCGAAEVPYPCRQCFESDRASSGDGCSPGECSARRWWGPAPRTRAR